MNKLDTGHYFAYAACLQTFWQVLWVVCPVSRPTASAWFLLCQASSNGCSSCSSYSSSVEVTSRLLDPCRRCRPHARLALQIVTTTEPTSIAGHVLGGSAGMMYTVTLPGAPSAAVNFTVRRLVDSWNLGTRGGIGDRRI